MGEAKGGKDKWWKGQWVERKRGEKDEWWEGYMRWEWLEGCMSLGSGGVGRVRNGLLIHHNRTAPLEVCEQ